MLAVTIFSLYYSAHFFMNHYLDTHELLWEEQTWADLKDPGRVPGHGIFQSLQLHPRQPGHPAGGGYGTFRRVRRSKRGGKITKDLPEPLPRLPLLRRTPLGEHFPGSWGHF